MSGNPSAKPSYPRRGFSRRTKAQEEEQPQPWEPGEIHVAVAGGSRSRGPALGQLRLGVAEVWEGYGLDGHRSRMTTPHLVLSGAVSHRLSG